MKNVGLRTAGILFIVMFGSRSGLAQSPGIPIRDNLPPQSCRISLEGPKKTWVEGDYTYWETPTESCSGTVIGSSELLTAAHCFYGQKFEKGYVYCPNQPPQEITSDFTNPKFTGTDGDKISPENGPYDVALVKIAGVFPAPPIRLAQDKEEIASLVKDPYNCIDYGYGNPQGGKDPVHHSIDVHFDDFRTTVVHYISFGDGVKHETGRTIQRDRLQNGVIRLEGEAIHKGDSGGGLMCKDSRGEWVMVGVNSGSAQADDEEQNAKKTARTSYIATLESSLDWLKGLMGAPFPDNRQTVAHAAPQQLTPIADLFSHGG